MKRRRFGLTSILLTLVASVASADTNVSGTISTSTTWTLANSPYVVTGAVIVAAASAPVLTIEAGVVVKFNAGSGNTCLAIGYGAPGRLVAVGTASQPIRFTSNQVTPTAGYWRGIFLLSAS